MPAAPGLGGLISVNAHLSRGDRIRLKRTEKFVMYPTYPALFNASRSGCRRWLFVALMLWGLPAPAAEPYPIAGLAPHERPKGAPVIRAFDAAPDWRRQALTGVAEPHPAGLDFLNNQGAWYTPFMCFGMTSPYDPRGWYVKGGRL